MLLSVHWETFKRKVLILICGCSHTLARSISGGLDLSCIFKYGSNLSSCLILLDSLQKMSLFLKDLVLIRHLRDLFGIRGLKAYHLVNLLHSVLQLVQRIILMLYIELLAVFTIDHWQVLTP